MSYSSVCQGLQSSVEHWHIEPRVLKLKLAPPASNTATPTHTPASTNSEPGGCNNWSFLQSLSNISHCKEPETENVYVHPFVRRSSSVLSAKSLELCTESLGCETGSDASDNTDDMSLFSLENNLRSNNTPVVINKNSESKRLNRGSTFPPPLTSMGGIKVRSHREDGRLILEAVPSSSPQPYFQAERANGRLRLRLFENVASNYGDEEVETETLNEQVCAEEDAELEENVGNTEDVAKFVIPRRCKFGDGYFEHPTLSLCL